MKILQVIHYFPPDFHAGAENYTYNLGKELTRRNDVFIYCRDAPIPRGPLTYKDEVFAGMQVRRIRYPQPETFIRSFYNEDIHDSFKAYLLEVKPDIVHFQHLVHLSLSCIDEVVRQSIPFAMTFHDFFYICPQIQMMKPGLRMCPGPSGGINCIGCENSLLKTTQIEWRTGSEKVMADPIFRRLLRALLPRHPVVRLKNHFFSEYYPVGELSHRKTLSFMRLQYILSRINKADLITAPSSYLVEKYKEAGVKDDIIFASTNGIDLSPFEGFTRKERKDKVRFSFIGTVSPHKGVHVLIEAFNRLPGDAAELNIFGNLDHVPHYTHSLEKLARHPGIHFRGKFIPQQVANTYRETDVLVIPSLWHENCPLVLLDAFIAKTPAIVSRGGAMDEFVQEGKNGFLFQMGDSADLAKKMMKFIREPDLIERMGRQAPKVKSAEEDARDWEERYREILKKRSA